MAMITTPKVIVGTAIVTSVLRMIIASKIPPLKPAMIPSTVPIIKERKVLNKATCMEDLAPIIILERMSRPVESVPKI